MGIGAMWIGLALAGGGEADPVEPTPPLQVATPAIATPAIATPAIRTTHWLGTGVAGAVLLSADGLGGFGVLPTLEWQVLSAKQNLAFDLSTTHLWSGLIVAGVFYGDLALALRGRWPVGERVWFTFGGGPELAFAGALFSETGNASIGLSLKAGVDLHGPADRVTIGLRWRGFIGPSLNDLSEMPVIAPLGAEFTVKWKLRPNR
jgi:hypothetical protein